MVSNASNAPRAVRYIKGKEIIVVVKTAEYHVIVILNPNFSRTSEPRGPYGPISFNIKKPTTVGGKTSGKVRIPSISPLSTLGVFAI